MADNDYSIVFQKIEEVLQLETAELRVLSAPSGDDKELLEIDEIRRFAAELIEPGPSTFTST